MDDAGRGLGRRELDLEVQASPVLAAERRDGISRSVIRRGPLAAASIFRHWRPVWAVSATTATDPVFWKPLGICARVRGLEVLVDQELALAERRIVGRRLGFLPGLALGQGDRQREAQQVRRVLIYPHLTSTGAMRRPIRRRSFPARRSSSPCSSRRAGSRIAPRPWAPRAGPGFFTSSGRIDAPNAAAIRAWSAGFTFAVDQRGVLRPGSCRAPTSSRRTSPIFRPAKSQTSSERFTNASCEATW